jgi:hypothetical protein
MGGARPSGPGRAAAVGVVLAAHAGVLVVLSIELDRRAGQPVPASPVSALILLSLPIRVPPPDRRRKRDLEEAAPIEPLAVPPIPAPDIELRGEVHAPIDWLAEAGRAAEAATAATPHTRAFGRMPQAPSWLGSSHSGAQHHAGDQYRLETGEWIVWVSDRCYIISEPAPLGMPDVLARSRGTQITCQAPAGPPPGELFKALPAYRKYHPQ